MDSIKLKYVNLRIYNLCLLKLSHLGDDGALPLSHCIGSSFIGLNQEAAAKKTEALPKKLHHQPVNKVMVC